VQIWDLAKQESVKEYNVFRGLAERSSDGRILVVASADVEEASVREVQTGEEIAKLSWTGKIRGTNVVGINSDGTLVGIGSPDGTCRLWKIRR
jgi:WD40 repeat protein